MMRTLDEDDVDVDDVVLGGGDDAAATGSPPSAQFRDVAARLGLDDDMLMHAWRNLDAVSQQCSLEGEALPWIACSVYQTILHRLSLDQLEMEPDRVQPSINALREVCQISVVEFFEKLTKWVEMASNSRRVRDHAARIQSNFAVSAVLMKKLLTLFRRVFASDAADAPSPTKSRPAKKRAKTSAALPFPPAQLFEFIWLLFCYSKKHFATISDDLMNSYHLLLCTVDLVCANLMANHHSASLTAEFSQEEDRDDDGSILALLCAKFDGVTLDAKHFRVHWWLPRAAKLFVDENMVAENADVKRSLLDTLPATLDKLHTDYNSWVTRRAEMDERILMPTPEQLAAPPQQDQLAQLKRSPDGKAHSIDTDLLLRMSVQSCLERVSHHRMPTPLSGKAYVISGDQFCPVTPVSAATANAARLCSLTCDDYRGPGPELDRILEQCEQRPRDLIASVLFQLGELFEGRCAESSGARGDRFDEAFGAFAKQRRQQAESLYYRLLERVVVAERDRLRIVDDVDFSAVLTQETFHSSLFACSLELVLFCYNSERKFPWVLEALGLSAIQFYKVIELVIRAEPELSKDMVKHLNTVEERVLEELAWRRDSPLWASVAAAEGDEGAVPSCEQVALSMPVDRSTGIPSMLTGGDGTHRQMSGSIRLTGGLPHRQSPDIMHVDEDTELLDVTSDTKFKGSLALFFRKVYYLANVRLLDLCERLRIDEKGRQHIWTLFERILRHDTQLMAGRHLDQNLMCCIYIVSKVLKFETSFHDIMCQYRYQPQSSSRVYRAVLVDAPAESSGGGGGDASAPRLRSASTLPAPALGSAPPTPEPLEEERVDLIRYYNRQFTSRVESFVRQLCPSTDTAAKEVRGGGDGDSATVPLQTVAAVPLSPLPNVRSQMLSPRRCVADSVFVQPMSHGQPPSPARPLRYSFNRSPYKDLKAINSMIRQGSDVGLARPAAYGVQQLETADYLS